jgi:hypothetical protein
MSVLGDERQWLHAALDHVGETIQKIRYSRLRDELLEVVNPEINTDRQTLISRMEQLGFRPGIVTRLRELDQKIYQARKSADFRDCMDATRIVFEELVEDAGRKAATFTGQGQPTVGVHGNFSPWKKLLVDTSALTGDEGVLFAGLYAYLSNAGSHRLESKPEQVRITKNIAIECGLLVVGRVQAMRP